MGSRSRLQTSKALRGRESVLAFVLAATFASDSLAAPVATPEAPSSDEAEPTVARAREAFLLGASLAREGEWPEALAAFTQSSQLHPHPVTTYNMAYCERALGHYTRAYKLFRRTLSEHADATRGTLPDDLFALTNAYLAEIEQRLARVPVRMTSPAIKVALDGRPLEVLSAPGDPRLVLVAGTRDDRGAEAPQQSAFDLLADPGRHVFVLSAPGAADEVRSETLEAGRSPELVLGRASALQPKPVVTSHVDAAVTVDSGKNDDAARSTWMWISYGVGGAGLVVGSIFGALALDKASFLSGKCGRDGSCDKQYQGDIDAGNRDALIANIGFGVAIAGAGVGTYLLLTRPHRHTERHAHAAGVTPLLGPTFVGAAGRF
jgi:hypothetical protein